MSRPAILLANDSGISQIASAATAALMLCAVAKLPSVGQGFQSTGGWGVGGPLHDSQMEKKKGLRIPRI